MLFSHSFYFLSPGREQSVIFSQFFFLLYPGREQSIVFSLFVSECFFKILQHKKLTVIDKDTHRERVTDTEGGGGGEDRHR